VKKIAAGHSAPALPLVKDQAPVNASVELGQVWLHVLAADKRCSWSMDTAKDVFPRNHGTHLLLQREGMLGVSKNAMLPDIDLEVSSPKP